MKNKYKIRFEYGSQAASTQGAVIAEDRSEALSIVTPDPRYKVTKMVCEEISRVQACLFSDDWDERLVK